MVTQLQTFHTTRQQRGFIPLTGSCPLTVDVPWIYLNVVYFYKLGGNCILKTGSAVKYSKW